MLLNAQLKKVLLNDTQVPALRYILYNALKIVEFQLAFACFSYFVSDIYETTWMKRHVYGHYTIVRNPHRSFSVLEPLPSGCKDNSTSTVEITAKARYKNGYKFIVY